MASNSRPRSDSSDSGRGGGAAPRPERTSRYERAPRPERADRPARASVTDRGGRSTRTGAPRSAAAERRSSSDRPTRRSGGSRTSVRTRPSKRGAERREMTESQKFASNKAQERSQRQRARTVRRVGAVVGAVALVGAVVWAIGALVSSPIFNVTKVVVTGNKSVPAQDIRSAVATDVATTVFKVKVDDVVASLAPLPWIASVTVDKRLPSTIALTVTERTAAATVSTTGKVAWVLSSDGVWLGTASDDGGAVVDPRGRFASVPCDVNNLVVIGDVPEPDVEVGRRSSSPEVRNVLKILAGLSAELRSQIRSVSATEVGNTKLFTADDVEIVIGSADDIAVKNKIIDSILKAHAGKVSLINVRSVDSPTWRGLTGE